MRRCEALRYAARPLATAAVRPRLVHGGQLSTWTVVRGRVTLPTHQSRGTLARLKESVAARAGPSFSTTKSNVASLVGISSLDQRLRRAGSQSRVCGLPVRRRQGQRRRCRGAPTVPRHAHRRPRPSLQRGVRVGQRHRGGLQRRLPEVSRRRADAARACRRGRPVHRRDLRRRREGSRARPHWRRTPCAPARPDSADRFRLQRWLAAVRPTRLPSELLMVAVQYCERDHDALFRSIDDPDVPIDNSPTET